MAAEEFAGRLSTARANDAGKGKGKGGVGSRSRRHFRASSVMSVRQQSDFSKLAEELSDHVVSRLLNVVVMAQFLIASGLADTLISRGGGSGSSGSGGSAAAKNATDTSANSTDSGGSGGGHSGVASSPWGGDALAWVLVLDISVLTFALLVLWLYCRARAKVGSMSGGTGVAPPPTAARTRRRYGALIGLVAAMDVAKLGLCMAYVLGTASSTGTSAALVFTILGGTIELVHALRVTWEASGALCFWVATAPRGGEYATASPMPSSRNLRKGFQMAPLGNANGDI